MSLLDPQHRHNALMRLRNMVLIIHDLQLEISVTVQQQPPLAIHQLLIEADYCLEMALKEIDQAAHRIRTI